MRLNSPEHKIIILCGGQGKRLGNITNKIPKPLVKVGNLTIIEHKLNYYKNKDYLIKNIEFISLSILLVDTKYKGFSISINH